jgi:hypothetical protein
VVRRVTGVQRIPLLGPVGQDLHEPLS